MTKILISGRELLVARVNPGDSMLFHLRKAVAMKGTMGSPPPQVERDGSNLLLIVASDMTEAEKERTKEWFIDEAVKASHLEPSLI